MSTDFSDCFKTLMKTIWTECFEYYPNYSVTLQSKNIEDTLNL